MSFPLWPLCRPSALGHVRLTQPCSTRSLGAALPFRFSSTFEHRALLSPLGSATTVCKTTSVSVSSLFLDYIMKGPRPTSTPSPSSSRLVRSKAPSSSSSSSGIESGCVGRTLSSDRRQLVSKHGHTESRANVLVPSLDVLPVSLDTTSI
jgi:hypothetical protein